MGMLIKEDPVKFIIKTSINIIYGIIIFGSLFVCTGLANVVIPAEYLIYFPAGFTILQTIKSALEKVEPSIKKKNKGSSTIDLTYLHK